MAEAPNNPDSKASVGITARTKSWANAFTKVTKLLRPEMDEYDCMIVTQKNFKRLVIKGRSNVLVVFYDNVPINRGELLMIRKTKNRSFLSRGWRICTVIATLM